MSPGSDTPPKRDALPLYAKSRQAKWRCYACVIACHKWSITCDPYGKKGTPTFLRDKHGRARPAEAKATQTISGHVIHIVQWALVAEVAFQQATVEVAAWAVGEKVVPWGSADPELLLPATELEVASPPGVVEVPMPAEVEVPLGTGAAEVPIPAEVGVPLGPGATTVLMAAAEPDGGEVLSLQENHWLGRNHILVSLIYDVPDWSRHNISLSSKFSDKIFYHYSWYCSRAFPVPCYFVMP
jgi:hypothetical protein